MEGDGGRGSWYPGRGGWTSRPRMSDVNCVYLIASVGASFTQEVLSDAFGMEKLQNFGAINYRIVAILHHECTT